MAGMKENSLKKTHSYSSRGLTSFLVAAGFLLMVVSGLVLYIMPHGRIAYWTNWQFISLTKDQWGYIHVLSSYLFAGAGIFHLYLNWRPFVNYIVDRVRGGIKLKKELFITIIVLSVILLSSIYRLPPLIYIAELEEHIKNSWIADETHEPPFGHAELVELDKFIKKMGFDLDESIKALDQEGIRIDNPAETLGNIADANRTSPLRLYEIMKRANGEAGDNKKPLEKRDR